MLKIHKTRHGACFNVDRWLREHVKVQLMQPRRIFRMRRWERLAFLLSCNGGTFNATPSTIVLQSGTGYGGHRQGLSTMEAFELGQYSGFIQGLELAGVDVIPVLRIYIYQYTEAFQTKESEIRFDAMLVSTGQRSPPPAPPFMREPPVTTYRADARVMVETAPPPRPAVRRRARKPPAPEPEPPPAIGPPGQLALPLPVEPGGQVEMF